MSEKRDYNILIKKDGKFYVGQCLEIPQARGQVIPKQKQSKTQKKQSRSANHIWRVKRNPPN